MITYTISFIKKGTLFWCILIMYIIFTIGCKKEGALVPSESDEDIFFVKDNPENPEDHAIFNFYEKTGIVCYYNDTIQKKLISRKDEAVARYAYTKLAFNYQLFGSTLAGFSYIKSKNIIPAFLKTLEQELIPKLPTVKVIPNFLLVDSVWSGYNLSNIQVSHGFTAYYGFNTVAIVLKDVEQMSNEEKHMYISSLLAGIAERRIYNLYASKLTEEFFGITRTLAKTLTTQNIYVGIPYMYLITPDKIPKPEDIGLLYHPIYAIGSLDYIGTPIETFDLRSYLTASFYYTTEEFTSKYSGQFAVVQKFNLVKSMLAESGFKVPD